MIAADTVHTKAYLQSLIRKLLLLLEKSLTKFFNSRAKSKVFVKTLINYVDSGQWKNEIENNKGSELYYIIQPVLKILQY